MQCVNCHLENIPGTQRCARCQSILELAGVDIQPPRAGPYRIASRVRRVLNPLSQGVTWSPDSPGQPAVRLPWQPAAWSLVPGLGHVRYDHRRLGWFLLICWLVCFPLMLVSITWAVSWLFLGLAILVHAAAILSFATGRLFQTVPAARGLFGVFLFAILSGFVYWPAGGLLQQLYIPVSLRDISSGSVLSDGDALLCQGPWLRPESFHRGDLVTYRLARPQLLGKSAAEGFNVDRIVGLPGDLVRIEAGQLTVNGQPVAPATSPVGTIPSGRYDLRVGPGQYMILPSATPLAARPAVLAGPDLIAASLVDQDDVLGRVVLRVSPLWRSGRVQ